MHRGHFRLLLGVMVAVTSLAIAGAASSAPERANAGVVIFGAEQEPPCLNGALAGCNNTWTSWTAGVALASLYIVRPDFSIQPYMANGPAKVTSKKPFTLLVKIKPKAKWSDGRQVTVNDLVFTWKTYVNPQNEVASRSGWDSIRKIVKVNAKTARIIFSKPYAGWRPLLVSSLYPSHALTGANFNEVWNNNYNNPKGGASMASGPMKVASYTRGQTLVLVRNASFWGKKSSIDRITFRFITNTDSEIQAIRGGEVDAIYPQPQLQLAALRGQSGLRTQSRAGTTLEHIDINTGAGNSNPLLGQRWFRQAIIQSIDRKAAVQQLFRTLNPSLPVLQNNMYTSNQKEYAGHFQRWTRNLNRVNALFRAHNCTKGGDGIYVCAGQRASVRFGTTAGNRLRELALEILQAQAKAAGIEFRPDSQPSRLFFPRLAEKNFDLALYAWVGTGDPSGWIDIYGCGGESNYKNYCNRTVTSLLRKSDQSLVPKTRASLVNQADALMATDVPVIPLYQKPTYFVYKTKLRGLVDNPTLQGPTWNTEFW
nr:peptide ABC transporter substrate-binding protein [Actinomycetota bacterium]